MLSKRNIALVPLLSAAIARAAGPGEIETHDSHVPYCVVDGDDAACPLGALGGSPPSPDTARIRSFSELGGGSASELELTTSKQRTQLEMNIKL